MEYRSDNIVKILDFTSNSVRPAVLKNNITHKTYDIAGGREFTICYRHEGCAGAKKRYFTSDDCVVVSCDEQGYTVAGGDSKAIFEVKVTYSSDDKSGALRKSMHIRCRHDVFIEYVDVDSLKADAAYTWSAPLVARVYVPSVIATFGQPVYIGDTFCGLETPVGDNRIVKGLARCRYHVGRKLSEVARHGTYQLPSHITGAGDVADFEHMRRAFFAYVDTFARPARFRIQFNSWYDNMLDINPSNIESSFRAVHKGLKEAGLRDLDCYVVDDGWTEYKKPLFWEFNDKFKEGFTPQAELTKELGSRFGVWFGPRGGYTLQTPKYAKHLTKIGYHYNRRSHDICTGDPVYIGDLCQRMADFCRQYNVTYYKIDGFAVTPCRSSRHGHPAGKGNGEAFYTFLWEEWCKGFEKIREVCPDVCLNITSYAHCSAWFLKWVDYIWMNNAADIYYIGKGDNLSQCLNYRDSRYRDFYELRQLQFPAAHMYNHEPCYAERNYNPPLPARSHKTVIYTDDEFRTYLKCCMMRGSGLAEIYFSPSLMDGNKWKIAAETLKWAEDNFEVLSASQFFGGDAGKGEVYGYIAARGDKYALMIRNSSDKESGYSFKLPGVGEIKGTLKPFEIKFADNLR